MKSLFLSVALPVLILAAGPALALTPLDPTAAAATNPPPHFPRCPSAKSRACVLVRCAHLRPAAPTRGGTGRNQIPPNPCSPFSCFFAAAASGGSHPHTPLSALGASDRGTARHGLLQDSGGAAWQRGFT